MIDKTQCTILAEYADFVRGLALGRGGHG